jgi:hypothetical protein
MFTFQPFDYELDGAFARASQAWGLNFWTAPLLVSDAYNINARRITTQNVDESWIMIEGERHNLLSFAFDFQAPEWADVDTGVSFTNPQNGPLSNRVNDPDTATGDIGVTSLTSLVAVSCLIRRSGSDSNPTIALTNGAGSPVAGTATTQWLRMYTVDALPGASATGIELATDGEDFYAWGAQIEIGPSDSDARFPSTPILSDGAPTERSDETYVPGTMTADMAEAIGFSISFRPEFSSSEIDIVTPEHRVFFWVEDDPDRVPLPLQIFVEITGFAGNAVIQAGMASNSVFSNALTWDAGDAITVTLMTDGSLTVTGCNTGNGTTTGPAWVMPGGFDVYVGARWSGIASIHHAFGLIGPVSLFFSEIGVDSIEQESLNSARLTFDHGVRQFNPQGLTDALNPLNYTVTGATLQSVGFGETDADVVLYFDQPIREGVTVTVTPHADIVSSGDVPIPTDPSPVSFIAFGELNAVELDPTFKNRVDIANPQLERDAMGGQLGTFNVTDSGDLANDSGRANLRKRVIRRVTTKKGSMVGNDGYGIDFPEKVLITANRLRQLQLDIEGQVILEPDVTGVRARLTERPRGIVDLTLVVTDNIGAFEIETSLNLG